MPHNLRSAPQRASHHDVRIALVTSTALAVCFGCLFAFALLELRAANARLARAQDVRGFAVEALGATQRAELDDLRARRAAGCLPPLVARAGAR